MIYMQKGMEILLFFAFLVLTSTLYIIYRWPYSPQDVFYDLEVLGPIGLVFDFLLIGLMFRWLGKSKKIDR